MPEERREHQRRDECNRIHTDHDADLKTLREWNEKCNDPKDGVIACINKKREEGDKHLHGRVDKKIGMQLFLWTTGALLAGILAVLGYANEAVEEHKDLAKKEDVLELKKDMKEAIREQREELKDDIKTSQEIILKAIEDLKRE